MPEEPASDPYGLCTSRPVSECSDCAIAGRLRCHFKRGDLLHFLGLFISFLLPALIGMVLAGYTWYLLGWLVLFLVLLGVWENRVLCSHCPYYAGQGRMLRCFANYGLLKLWRYRPGPAGRLEKAQFGVIVVLLTGYPFPFLILGGQYVLAFLAAWAVVMWGWTLQRYSCSRCVNFSCLFNRVPREVADEFLKRNPAMRKAWEESGWVIGDADS
jgi:hypothetical protein